MAKTYTVMDLHYSLIAELNDQSEIFYGEYGDYQGEWILVTYADDMFYIYKGGYGSCSGCDHVYDLHDHYWRSEITKEELVEEFSIYTPFITVSVDTMEHIIEKDAVETILPYNLGWTGNVDYPEIVEAIKRYMEVY